MKIYEIESGEKSELGGEEGRMIDILKSNCSEAIAAMQQAGGFLYRGISNAPAAFHGRSRVDRKPLHTNAGVHSNIDEVFITYGFATNRSNSIFCIGNKPRTNMYGNPYIIFPKNGSEILWSPRVKDLFTEDKILDDAALIASTNDKLGLADRFVKTYQYTDKNLAAAIQSKCEIMVSGEYYAFYAKPFKHTKFPAFQIEYETLFSTVFNIPGYKEEYGV